MAGRKIFITEFYRKRLRELLVDAISSEYRGSPYLKNLRDELERAQIVEPSTVPPTVITMNSQVRLKDLSEGDEMVYTLVFPQDANLSEGKISILAPIGTAMLGYQVGDVVEWNTPGGLQRFKIVDLLFQPEAAGRFDL